jgi:sigma-B regulation protein RsbU (phosphoserine phosphatase)
MSEASVTLTTASSGSVSTVSRTPAAPLVVLVLTERPEFAGRFSSQLDPAWFEVRKAKPRQWLDGLEADAVLIDIPADDPKAIEKALAAACHLHNGSAAVVAIGDRLSRAERIALYHAGVLACLAAEDESTLRSGSAAAAEDGSEELAAHLASLVTARRTSGVAIARLREHTRNLDEQLRLAQRLQMDFLPRRLPEVVGGRFAARIEPAAWVAGDFYDIFRLDERHVGFYVADAVGHGVPAALLTVFVKKSLQTKRIDGKQYELIPPEEALRLLNADLLSAELKETPFITMVYGVYNEETRRCCYARAGHPKPILLGPQGSLETLEGDGPLLGVFAGATFEARERPLAPGERLLLYTDGAERIEAERRANPAALLEVLRASALLPLEALIDSVFDAVHAATGGRHLADDVTLVAMELTTL